MAQLHWLIGAVLTGPQTLKDKHDRGAITLEAVIWAAGISVAAIAVIALIVAVITGYVAKIPT